MKTIVFPTGEFIGVYYSEEFKYAQEISYQIIHPQATYFRR